MKKAKHILKAIASGFLPGLGQVLNRQFIKAIFFFVIFAGCISIELSTSNYFTGYDVYTEVLEKETESLYDDEFFKEFITYYERCKQDGKINDPDFDRYCQENGISKDNQITTEQVLDYYVKEIKQVNEEKYYLLSDFIQGNNFELKQRESDIIVNTENQAFIKGLKKVVYGENTFYDVENKKEYISTGKTDKNGNLYYVNINDESELINNVDGFLVLSRQNEYRFNVQYKVYIKATYTEGEGESQVERTMYINVLDSSDTKTTLDKKTTLAKYKENAMYGDVYYSNDNKLYVHFNPLNEPQELLAAGVGFVDTPMTDLIEDWIGRQHSKVGSSYKGSQAVRFFLEAYFKIDDEVRIDFEESYDFFFHDRAGFFLKGIWSVITLGQVDKHNYTQHTLLLSGTEASRKEISGYLTSIPLLGHVTSNLLITGLIAVLLLCFFIFFHVWSVRDAYISSKKNESAGCVQSSKEWFKDVYENSFEYIVLSPAIFVIVFITLMPILFGFLIAFTSYSGYSADLGRAEWVGFDNFINIFSFGSVGDAPLPFGKMFWKVFLWTVIWAFASSFTVFFGGFLQALVVNNEHVPFKKFWRTVLILPWAVPAIISQMVFSVMFVDQGVVNEFLKSVGVYDILIDWGVLGTYFDKENMNLLQRIFYMGNDNIEWFTNASNKWFVRGNLVLLNIWLGFPYYMALMSSTMTSIDRTLYEAAEIDGASKFQRFKYVTFPLVMLSTAPLLVMCVSGNFNNFGVIYFITQGGVNNNNNLTAFAGDTDILISWMYRLTIDKKVYNFASVFSILIFVILGTVSAWNFTRTKAFKED